MFYDFENVSPDNIGLSYEYYFGQPMARGSSEETIYRIDDYATWTVDGNSYEFDVLVTDVDRWRSASTTISSAHPDREGILPLRRNNDSNSAIHIYGGPAPVRGDIDRNFLRTDGSCFRLPGIATPDPVCDSRVVPVPYRYETPNHAKGYLPPR